MRCQALQVSGSLVLLDGTSRLLSAGLFASFVCI